MNGSAQPAGDAAVTSLLRALARVQRNHAERAADPELSRSLAYLGAWQARRMHRTYADLEASLRYGPAIRFFESDLYGGTDFTGRDHDLTRVIPAMRRLLPDSVLDTVASAIELNALSQDLDRAMAGRLRPLGERFGVADYCAAYRRVGDYPARRRQIALVGDVGRALDRYVAKPMIRTALKVMRKPAQVAGLSALQDFLERGFAAFAQMRGADEFLAMIEARERAIHDAIAGGADDPFPDPMA